MTTFNANVALDVEALTKTVKTKVGYTADPLTGRITNLVAGSTDVPAVMTLAKSAVPITHTGTVAATVIATVKVPGGSMGPNGGVRVTAYWSMTNNVNGKRLVIRFGGGATEMFNANLTSVPASACQVEVTNRGATGSQILNGGGTGVSFGTLTAFNVSSEDTTADQNIQFVATLANAADTLTLERYTVELLK